MFFPLNLPALLFPHQYDWWAEVEQHHERSQTIPELAAVRFQKRFHHQRPRGRPVRLGHRQLPDGKLPGGKNVLTALFGSKCSHTTHITGETPPALQKNLWNAYIRPEGSKTVGSMDLGGASTQIAFAVQDELAGSDYMHIKLYGYPYNVYTHSFLCYGKNEAEKMILDAVVQVRSLTLPLLRVAPWQCAPYFFFFFTHAG